MSPPPSTPPGEPSLTVDWLGPEDLRDGLAGRLGLTSLPGKHGASVRYPGLVYRRELDDDLAQLLALGVRHIFLLVEDAELERWGDGAIVARGAAQGLTVSRHPMPDGGTPATVSAALSLVADIAGARSSADAAIACMGGVGRTGTVAACALVVAGMSADAAIARVRSVRHPYAVETRAQEAFVHRVERAISAPEVPLGPSPQRGTDWYPNDH